MNNKNCEDAAEWLKNNSKEQHKVAENESTVDDSKLRNKVTDNVGVCFLPGLPCVIDEITLHHGDSFVIIDSEHDCSEVVNRLIEISNNPVDENDTMIADIMREHLKSILDGK